MHGNLDKHPDIPEIMKNLDTAIKAHERNQFIASNLILIGTGMVTAGTVLLKVEKFRQKHHR